MNNTFIQWAPGIPPEHLQTTGDEPVRLLVWLDDIMKGVAIARYQKSSARWYIEGSPSEWKVSHWAEMTAPGAPPAVRAFVAEEEPEHGKFGDSSYIDAKDTPRTNGCRECAKHFASEQMVVPIHFARELEREADWLRGQLERAEQEASAWISTKDRLPADGQSVAFVCTHYPHDHADTGGRILGGRFVAGDFGRFSVPGMMTGADYWMPLPAAPAATPQPTRPNGR